MRKAFLAAAGLIVLAFPLCYAASQEPSVAEAARKAREQKKNAPKSAKVVTNDDLRAGGTISILGASSSPAPSEESPAKPALAGDKAAKPKEKEDKDEAYWRKRFAEARARLRDAEKELDLLQRELNLNQQQYYSDPNKALREQYTRKDINEQTRKIEEKKKEVAQLKQDLADLENELRSAGGDPGWSREP